MNRRLLAALLALMLALGGACLADGEEGAPAEPAAEQSAPEPEVKSEPKSTPEPEPEPEQKPESEPESEPEPEDPKEDGNGGESEEDVSDDDAPDGNAPEGEVPPASNSVEPTNGDGNGDEITGDETSGDETSGDETTGDEDSEDEITGDGLDEEQKDEPEDEGDGGETGASLTVGIEGMERSDGVWRVPAGTVALRFTWNEIEGADGYAWSVAERGESGSASGGALELNIADYAPGTYTFTVSAAGAEGSARFAIEESGGPGEEPGPDEPEPAEGLTVAAEGATQLEDGAWQFPADAEMLRFSWTAVEGAAGYSWSIGDAEPQDVQASTAIELSVQDYASGRFTLTVTARFDDGRESLIATLTFEVAQSQRPGWPGGFPGFGRRPGGFGGGRPSGSRPSGGAGGELPAEEQGFRVTPGVALTDDHASGAGDMSAYGAVALDFTGEVVCGLALSGDAPDVRLASGGEFAAGLDGDTMTLFCGDASAEWRVNPLALRALRQSGVNALVLGLGGESVALPTDLELTGDIYASYRMRGYVSKDFELRVTASGVAAVVDGEAYALSDAYELIQV